MSTKKQKQAQELLDAMNVLEKEKGIKKEVVIEALTDALEKAYKTNYNASNVEVKIDENTGEFKVFSDKKLKTLKNRSVCTMPGKRAMAIAWATLSKKK